MIREILEGIIGLTSFIAAIWGAWVILHGFGF